MKTIRNYIEELSFVEMKEIFKNQEELDQTGVLGDCLLRSLTEKIVKNLKVYHPSIIIWMNMVTNECYKYIAEKAMEQGFEL